MSTDRGGRDAGPGVAHGQAGAISASFKSHFDFALEGELEGIGKKIQDDLLPHIVVHADRLAQVIDLDLEAQTGLFDGGSKDARQVRRQARQIREAVGGIDPAGLDAREVEQGVHQLQKPPRISVDAFLPLSLARRQRLSVSASESSSGPSIKVSGVLNS